jgi:hypothetical protein
MAFRNEAEAIIGITADEFGDHKLNVKKRKDFYNFLVKQSLFLSSKMIVLSTILFVKQQIMNKYSNFVLNLNNTM